MFLELNGTVVTGIADDIVYELVIDISANDHPVEDIARKLQRSVEGS